LEIIKIKKKKKRRKGEAFQKYHERKALQQVELRRSEQKKVHASYFTRVSPFHFILFFADCTTWSI